MGNNKSQLVVAAIENGTVIDHIPAEKTYQVAVSYTHLTLPTNREV